MQNKLQRNASLMSRSDTEYTKFGTHEEFESSRGMSKLPYEDYERRSMSAMQYKDYNYSPSSKALYEPYDDTAKSMNEPSIFHSNDSLNTTAQSVFSDYSAATADRRNKISAISSAIPVVSSFTNSVNNQQMTDPYQNYTPSTSECLSNHHRPLGSALSFDLGLASPLFFFIAKPLLTNIHLFFSFALALYSHFFALTPEFACAGNIRIKLQSSKTFTTNPNCSSFGRRQQS